MSLLQLKDEKEGSFAAVTLDMSKVSHVVAVGKDVLVYFDSGVCWGCKPPEPDKMYNAINEAFKGSRMAASADE